MNRFQFQLVKFVVLSLTAVAYGHSVQSIQADEPRFEKDIQAFEKQDQEHQPQSGQVVFVGSSTIRKWDLKQSYPKLDALNRGFGGSHISDCVVFAKRIVNVYKPRLIVFYAGDNDIADGKSAERVAQDFQAFVEAVRADLPTPPIAFLSIKPSPSRVKLLSKQTAANQLIKSYIGQHEHLTYVDIATAMLDEQGQPRPEFFVQDMLHMNELGYKLCVEKLKDVVK